MRQTIAIVGGGIAGLTVAYRLTSLKKQNNLPIEIILIENNDRLGGVIKSEPIDNFIVEHGPDAFLNKRTEFSNLLSELKLTEDLLPTNETNRQAFIAKNTQLIALPAGFFMIAPTQWLSFATSPIFTLLGKLRIALEVFMPPNNTQSDESVANFLRRHFGNEHTTRLGQPVVGGIHMADINLLSKESTLPQFTRLEKEYGSIIRGLFKNQEKGAATASGARYNLFNSLHTGMQALIDRLTEKLTDLELHFSTKLIEIEKGNQKNWLLKTNRNEFEADAIVLAIPAQLAALTLNRLDAPLSKALAQIQSSNSVVINLLYNKNDIGKYYKGFGFVVPAFERRKIVAAAFISQKFSHRSCNGYEMIRVFMGGQLAPELFTLTDRELINLAQGEIGSYLKIKNPATRTWIQRWPNGLPFYQVGHKEIVQTIENLAKIHSGLFFTGSSYNGLGIPDCVSDGEKTATLLAKYLEQRKQKCLSQTVRS